ncbi:leucyl aminopeptidase [Paramicrobacterium chengjingii]|uniref:Probable cytosol aminopeptidase n=1 Tax=Paramicrobacterium chengjingii TaxID=2769067 RepID=A0ABX6YNU4_9MICO|nr:leucyl aminopeptidase [Microbacterium chengjingii]QPZ40051.1 leucyl aminopeptidase [Microbacterium chengjingii]
MSQISLEFETESAPSTKTDITVIGAVSSSDGPRLHAIEGFESLTDMLTNLGVSGSADALSRVVLPDSPSTVIAVVGLGREVTADALRGAAGAAVRQLAGIASVRFAFPLTDHADVIAVAEGAALGAYAYTQEKGMSERTSPVEAVTIVAPEPLTADEAKRVVETARAVHLVRDLGNTSASALTPEVFADTAVDEASDLPITTRVWDVAQLESEGFGGILGVGRGSERGPRLVKLDYSPAGATSHIALVGKGITFDTGGLSLKPASGMMGMKYDMLGAATALATITAAARIGINTRITAWLCLAENMPSGSATRPGDVLKMYGGRTVEVTNTDAEGRLVMADGLVAASEENPDLIVDVATLTGAAVVALGKRYTGVMGNDESAAEVVDIADGVGEKFWRMPLPSELRSALDSDVADLVNANLSRREGGMLVAGHFLSEFIGTRTDTDEPISWVHLDIAGPGDNGTSTYGYNGKGATGVTVRTLLTLAERHAGA